MRIDVVTSKLRCTHCTYGLVQFGSAVFPWNTTVIPAGGEGTSYSKPFWNYSERGMRWSRTVENDLDKGDEHLFHYLELCHTEKSCRCISKNVLNHVSLTLKDTWMRLEPAPRGRINVNWHYMIRPKHPSSCNSAGVWIAKLLLVETCDVNSGSACFQVPVARKR